MSLSSILNSAVSWNNQGVTLLLTTQEQPAPLLVEAAIGAFSTCLRFIQAQLQHQDEKVGDVLHENNITVGVHPVINVVGTSSMLSTSMSMSMSMMPFHVFKTFQIESIPTTASSQVQKSIIETVAVCSIFNTAMCNHMIGLLHHTEREGEREGEAKLRIASRLYQLVLQMHESIDLSEAADTINKSHGSIDSAGSSLGQYRTLILLRMMSMNNLGTIYSFMDRTEDAKAVFRELMQFLHYIDQQQSILNVRFVEEEYMAAVAANCFAAVWNVTISNNVASAA